MSILELLRSDGSIVINKRLACKIGLHETILYSELISRYLYFKDKDLLTDEGFFFNTVEDLELATTLSDKQQRGCIKRLTDLKLIFYKVKGLPAKRYFKINEDMQLIINLLESEEKQQLRKKGRTGFGETAELKTQKGQCNNTNTNNTKEIILKNLNVVLADRKDRGFFEIVFCTYLNSYLEYIGQVHPKLSIDIVRDIVDKIDRFGDEYNIVSSTEWQRMIEIYFRSKLDCDRNMLHFVQEGILYNRADNLRLIK